MATRPIEDPGGPGLLIKAGRIDLLVNNAGIGLLGGAEESSIAHSGGAGG
jgi:NAD(P)-dependent dehydrogenase (short-subunit alcohol dehydrogenase family)